MQKTIFSVFLLLILIMLGCKENSPSTTKNQPEERTETGLPQEQSINKVPLEVQDIEEEEAEPTNNQNTPYKSLIRPKETIEMGKIYTDTMEFLSYNLDGDNFYLIGEIDTNEVWLMDNIDLEEVGTRFKYGDVIKVEWSVEGYRPAGDPEIVQYTESVIDAQKISSTNKPIKFLWRADKYIEELEGTFNSIFLNEHFCQSISDPEKAALGFIATFVGNECQWDGKANDDRSNLNCIILTALNLGYQCSEDHLGFVKKWFANDADALKKLENCPTTPYGATIQDTFDEIFISSTENTITISYKTSGFNTRRSTSWSWDQTDYFSYDSESVSLIQSEKSEIRRDD